MSARLLIDVWHDVADPWSRIGINRLARGIDLACAARRSSSRAGHDFAGVGHGEAHGSASDAAFDFPEVVVEVHSFLSPGSPLPEANAEAIAAVAASEEIPVAKERLLRPPSQSLRRLAHRIVHAVREGAEDPADGARRALEAAIRLDDWFLGFDNVSDSGTPADSLAQAAAQPGSELRLGKGVQTGKLAQADDAPPNGRGQADQSALDADQGLFLRGPIEPSLRGPIEPSLRDPIEPSPRMLGRIAGLAPSDLPTLERRLELGEWEAAVDRDIADAKRLRIRGLPLTVVGARVMLVGAQSPKVFAEAILEAAAALGEGEQPPQARRFAL